MAAPDRIQTDEHDALNPPVIPVFWLPRSGKKLQGMTSQIGWEGFKLVQGGEGWKVVKDLDFTLYICPDGYAEIPATPSNKKRLEVYLKPLPVYAMLMKTARDEEGNEIQVAARDPETGKVVYTDKLLRTDPPSFRLAAAKRTFDPKESTVDYIRPWLRQFVQVPGAIMEPMEG